MLSKYINKYEFFKEYSNGQAVTTSFQFPDDVIVAESIHEAIDKFLKRDKLKQESLDVLSGHEWRIFIYKTRLFKKPVESIFYIKEEDVWRK